MKLNLTESFVDCPWIPWLLLVLLCLSVDLLRRDGWGAVTGLGLIPAAIVAMLMPELFGWQFVAAALGIIAAVTLTKWVSRSIR
ncbi:MAG: hypothetical protein ACRDAX_04975 [Propionibacteriaceae bacterium]